MNGPELEDDRQLRELFEQARYDEEAQWLATDPGYLKFLAEVEESLGEQE